jgi:hypothetical protein
LNEKAQPENKAAGQPHDFPRMDHDSEEMRLGEKLEAAHKGKGSAKERRFTNRRLFLLNPGLDLSARQAKKSHA